MKKIILILFVCIFIRANAQDESIYLSVGKPWFPDKDNNLNNFSIGINYQNRFSQSFAFDLSLEYSKSDDFPNFFNNPNDLNKYLSAQIGRDIHFNSLWSKINMVNIGAKMDYMFVNNDKFLFNFNLGLGYLFSYSKSHIVENWTYDLNTGKILSYENKTVSNKLNTFYYNLGIQFQYTLYKNYFIGINPSFLLPIGDKKLNLIPVYPNYYNLSLNFGKKF